MLRISTLGGSADTATIIGKLYLHALLESGQSPSDPWSRRQLTGIQAVHFQHEDWRMTTPERRIHRVTFDGAGALDVSEAPLSPRSFDYQGIPVVALQITAGSGAEHVYRRFCLLEDPGDLVTQVSPWVPLAGDDSPAGHAGHPLLDFTFVSTVESDLGHGPREALGFVVCAQCEGDFVRHAASAEWIALGASAPEAGQGDAAGESVVELAVAECDPDEIAWAELRAWRYAYTIAGPSHP